MRVFTLLGLLFCLPIFLLAQRPVSVRTDEGRGVKQEQRTTASERPAASRTTSAEAPRTSRPTAPPPPRTTNPNPPANECPPTWGQTPDRTERTTRSRTTRSRTRTTVDRARTRPVSGRPSWAGRTTRTQSGTYCPPGWQQRNDQRTWQQSRSAASRASQPTRTTTTRTRTTTTTRTQPNRPAPSRPRPNQGGGMCPPGWGGN